MQQYPNNEQTNLKKMNTALIITLSVAILALLIVLVALFFSTRGKKNQNTSGPRVVAGDEAADELNGGEETTAAGEIVQATDTVSASATNTTAPAATAEPTVTATPAPAGGVGATGLYTVSYATPSHAGVVVRGGPSSSDEKLGVLPEGFFVEYDSSVPTQNGYARICYVGENHLKYGWVMAVYLNYHSDAGFSGNWGPGDQDEVSTPGKSSGGGMGHEGYPYVSYSTPSHAGVVVRGGPSSSAEKLGVIAEGTAVNPTGESSNGYSEVVVDPYGQGYVGWILTQYITYQ